MQTRQDIDAMIRELQENGFSAAQSERYDFAYWAAKVAAVALLCAKHDAGEIEMLDALQGSCGLGAEAAALIGRMEMSAAFVGFVHSARRF